MPYLLATNTSEKHAIECLHWAVTLYYLFNQRMVFCPTTSAATTLTVLLLGMLYYPESKVVASAESQVACYQHSMNVL